MFERYTEKARRVIFYARFEASQFGSPNIETEHLLLGLVREDKALSNRFLRSEASFESIRKQVEGHTTVGASIATSVDLPLSNECKRVLGYAAEEAERLSHKHIGTEHLLLGILREEKCFAAELLRERGVGLAALRQELANTSHIHTASVPAESSALTEWFGDLTQAARAGQLDPILGRDLEIDGLIDILSCRYKNNALLIGPRGAGKTAIVEALAQRIAEGKAPSCLADRKIITLKADAPRNGPRERQRLDEVLKMATEGGNTATIVVFDEAQRYSEEASSLPWFLHRPGIQCVGIMHSQDEASWTRTGSWLDEFQAVYVGPLNEENTLAVLAVRKQALEAFHGVTYTEEALQFAVQAAASYRPEDALPGKAMDLLDAAGSRVKSRQPEPPIEVAEVEMHLRAIIGSMENSIANHEFERARYYSEEERRERKKLQEVREKHHLGDVAALMVRPQELKEVIARWTAYPYCP